MKTKQSLLILSVLFFQVLSAQTDPEYEKCYKKYPLKKGSVNIDGKDICKSSSSLDKCLCRNQKKKEKYLEKLKRLELLDSQETTRLDGLVKNYNKYNNLARDIQVKLYGTDVDNFESKKKQAISYYKSAYSSLNFYDLRFLCNETIYKPKCESIKKDKAGKLKFVNEAIEELENLKPKVSATFIFGKNNTNNSEIKQKKKEIEKKEIESKVSDYMISQKLIKDLPNMKKRAEYYKKIGDWKKYNEQMKIINHVKNNLLTKEQRRKEDTEQLAESAIVIGQGIGEIFKGIGNIRFNKKNKAVELGFGYGFNFINLKAFQTDRINFKGEKYETWTFYPKLNFYIKIRNNLELEVLSNYQNFEIINDRNVTYNYFKIPISVGINIKNLYSFGIRYENFGIGGKNDKNYKRDYLGGYLSIGQKSNKNYFWKIETFYTNQLNPESRTFQEYDQTTMSIEEVTLTSNKTQVFNIGISGGINIFYISANYTSYKDFNDNISNYSFNRVNAPIEELNINIGIRIPL